MTRFGENGCLVGLRDPRPPGGSQHASCPSHSSLPWPLSIFMLSLVPLAVIVSTADSVLAASLILAYQSVAPLRTINGYGLFAVMTKERREIIVQGSDDGVTWKSYVFRFKPGDPRRAPPLGGSLHAAAGLADVVRGAGKRRSEPLVPPSSWSGFLRVRLPCWACSRKTHFPTDGHVLCVP